MNNLTITKLKAAYINRDVLGRIAAESLAKINPASRDGKRWIKAIGKAVVTIEENPEMIFDLKNAVLHITGSKGEQYTANGICQCTAYIGGFPCYHRAAARLIQRYAEAMQ